MRWLGWRGAGGGGKGRGVEEERWISLQELISGAGWGRSGWVGVGGWRGGGRER